MIPNINPETGIAYGYISANALKSEVIDELMYCSGHNVSADEAFTEWSVSFFIDHDREPDESERQEFWDGYEDYEPTIKGTCEGVEFQTSWLGGALNFFIFKSPVITDKARLASPCVPNAGILDTLDGSVTSYDVPADWRRKDE